MLTGYKNNVRLREVCPNIKFKKTIGYVKTRIFLTDTCRKIEVTSCVQLIMFK